DRPTRGDRPRKTAPVPRCRVRANENAGKSRSSPECQSDKPYFLRSIIRPSGKRDEKMPQTDARRRYGPDFAWSSDTNANGGGQPGTAARTLYKPIHASRPQTDRRPRTSGREKKALFPAEPYAVRRFFITFAFVINPASG